MGAARNATASHAALPRLVEMSCNIFLLKQGHAAPGGPNQVHSSAALVFAHLQLLERARQLPGCPAEAKQSYWPKRGSLRARCPDGSTSACVSSSLLEGSK